LSDDRAELVQDVVMQYEPQADEQGLTLQADLPERHARVRTDIGLVEWFHRVDKSRDRDSGGAGPRHRQHHS
jgi:hypothetical protein